MKKLYFEIHVFFSRKNGFSIPMAVDIEELPLGYSDEDIIELAVKKGQLEADDAGNVDSVNEIEEDEFKQMGGI